jgi:hypothetical protein
MAKHTYDVIVGNIGTVYSGPSRREAERRYNEYVEQSQTNDGRAAGEPVALMRDNDIFMEYFNPEEELEIDEYPVDPEAVNRDREGK